MNVDGNHNIIPELFINTNLKIYLLLMNYNCVCVLKFSKFSSDLNLRAQVIIVFSRSGGKNTWVSAEILEQNSIGG
jgi:hypothetical protein